MPFETMTNYGAAGSLRCNFDNQSLLYLPPGSVLKLLHSPNIGRKPEYAHMERKEGDMNPKWLLPVADGSVETDEVDTRPADDIETCEALLKELESECLSAFQDAHNTGFYINEYTTKVNALGDKILEGLRRASEKIVREEAARTPDVAEDAKRRADRERIKAVLKKTRVSHEQFAGQERLRTSFSNALRPYVILDAQNLGDEHASSICESFEQLGAAFRWKPQSSPSRC